MKLEAELNPKVIRGKENSVVTNPNPNPNRENSAKNPNQRNRKGKEKKEGGSARLTSPSCMPPRGEKKGSAGGDLLAGTATRAPRPGRSTAARSPTGERARRRGGRRRRRGLLSSLAVEAPRSVSAAAGLSGEERGAKRERESEAE